MSWWDPCQICLGGTDVHLQYLHPNQSKLVDMFNWMQGWISKLVSRWVLLWGKVGKQIKILMIDEDYLRAAMPAEYRILDFGKVVGLVDGNFS